MTKSKNPTRISGVSKRGFASMDPERQREIARKGGASVPGGKRSFSQDRSLAASAGRKGGEASRGSGTVAGQKSLLDGHHPQRDF